MWISLSILAVFLNAAKVLTIKHLCSRIDSRFLIFCSRITAAAVFIPALFILGCEFPLSKTFWIVLLVTSCLTAVSSILLTDAIRHGRLAVVMPMQAAIPVFMLMVLFVAKGESPNFKSVVYIICAALSLGYTLYQSSSNKNSAAAGKVLIFGIFSLVSAFLMGITTVLDRTAIAAVSAGALAYSGWWNLVSAVILFFECTRARSFNMASGYSRPGIRIAFYSTLALLAFFTQQYAVQKSLTIPGGVIHVKTIVMLHLPLVIGLNYIFLPEKISKKVLIGGLLSILFGILLIRSQL
jgi:drug/metabolite transporter (DMT)-like permease